MDEGRFSVMLIPKLAEQSDLVTATNPRMVPLEPEGQIVTFSVTSIAALSIGLFFRARHESEDSAARLSVTLFCGRIDRPGRCSGCALPCICSVFSGQILDRECQPHPVGGRIDQTLTVCGGCASSIALLNHQR